MKGTFYYLDVKIGASAIERKAWGVFTILMMPLKPQEFQGQEHDRFFFLFIQIFFFTDATDPHLEERVGEGHLINTNCSSSHHRRALCCKMAVEFDTFLESNKK